MIPIDKFEYPTDIEARASWISSAEGGIDSYVKLLLHMDGESSTFTDSSLYAHVITPNGSVVQTDAQYKWGKSAYFPGTGDHLSIPDSDDWNFASGDFTIDSWIYLLSNSGGIDHMIACQYSVSAYSPFYFAVYDDRLCFLWSYSDGTWNNISNYVGGISLNTDTWYHVAAVRNGTTIKTYVNGIADLNITSVGTLYDSSGDLMIGKYSSFPTLYGYLDELRISKGKARWTSNFTPPSAPYDSSISLQCYSESLIKYNSPYSMKVIATTDSLNQTLTKTCSPTWNLSGQNYLKIWVRATRIGTNFKIGLHDSEGTTTESNIVINLSNTWELKTIDISAVSDVNKDAIDNVIITITNSDAENIIYFNDMLADNRLIDKISMVNRNSFLLFRGRNRDLPSSLIIEKTT